MQPCLRSPQISIIIPTYNRCDLLASTLSSLAVQNTTNVFEVIVSDDGSSDATFHVCQDFHKHLRLRYRYQQDIGFRAAAARNGGAQMARAPVIAFLDSGCLPGPDFVEQHVAAHSDASTPGCAVAGYTFGYRPRSPTPNLAQIVASSSPASIVDRHGDDPTFWDWRHDELAKVGFDLTAYAAPWLMFWAMNCSVRADDFWRAGGFAESFGRWGVEDIEMGLRLHRSGVRILFSRDAWALESPHDRDVEQNIANNRLNLGQLIDTYRDDVLIELAWAAFMQDGLLFEVERDYQDLLAWTEKAREVDVYHEISMVGAVRPGRLAIFGCGARLPSGLPDAELFEFDDAVMPDANGGRHQTHRGIGLHTPLPAQSMDLVLITSRLDGLRDRWHDRLMAEASRIGRTVLLTADTKRP